MWLILSSDPFLPLPALLSITGSCNIAHTPLSAAFLLGMTSRRPWQETGRQEEGISLGTFLYSAFAVFSVRG